MHMTLTLNLDPQIEQQLRQEAQRRGLQPDDYILEAIRERLRQSAPLPPHLAAREAALLGRMDLGLSQEQWARFHTLARKLEDGSFAPLEREEFVSLNNRIEKANARRLEALAELSGLRRLPIEQVMAELGIAPRVLDDTNE